MTIVTNICKDTCTVFKGYKNKFEISNTDFLYLSNKNDIPAIADSKYSKFNFVRSNFKHFKYYFCLFL